MWNPTYLEIAARLRRSEIERLTSRPALRLPAAARRRGLGRGLAARLVALGCQCPRREAGV